MMESSMMTEFIILKATSLSQTVIFSITEHYYKYLPKFLTIKNSEQY